jgi:serine/threonine-protein kinase
MDRANWQIAIQSLKSGERKVLLRSGFDARYLPTKHLVYKLANNNIDSCYAVAFNLDKLEAIGGPVPIIENVRASAVSGSGTLAFIPGAGTAGASGSTLVWVDREGREELLGTLPNDYAHPKISPDGTRVAVSIGPFNNEEIWIWDVVRRTMTRLTFGKGRKITPLWTPDGKRIVYHSTHENAPLGGVYWKAADGTGEVEKIGSAPDRALNPYSWSSDGKILVVQEAITAANVDLSILQMEGERTRKVLLQADYLEGQPRISPDGRWMAYFSNESGQNEVYVRPFPEVNKGRWLISTGGGACPLWSPDGRELFYLSEDNSVMAVAVETKPTISFGTPKNLFKSIYAGAALLSGVPWDIHPDGKRFLMIKPPRGAAIYICNPAQNRHRRKLV